MNVNLLIDAIVRQTTILIAQLATATGLRSPLSHMANQIFVDLVKELKEQGLGNKVIADMFGLSLRTYHNRIRRMSESSTERGRTLWEAVLDFVQKKGTVLRCDVERNFCRDDEVLVHGVLKDLVESGFLFRSGVGENLTYRAANQDEMLISTISDGKEAEADLIQVAVKRYGPVSSEALREMVPISQDKLYKVVEKLIAEGRIQVRDSQGESVLSCDECIIPINASFGWEAAVLDHYQAVVTAICTKLRKGLNRALDGETIGGSTYSFEIWDQHPLREEVLGFLQNTRKRAQNLRKRVESYNKQHVEDHRSIHRVYTYVGQTVIEPEEKEET